MNAATCNEAGSRAGLSSLEDAKAVGPATPSNVLPGSMQSKELLLQVEQPVSQLLLPASTPSVITSGTVLAEPGSRKATISRLASQFRSGELGPIAWDEFLFEVVLAMGDTFTILDDDGITALVEACELLGMTNVRPSDVKSALHMVAKENPVDSAKLWLDRLPAWDGIPRVGRFLPNYLGTANRKYHAAVGRYWLTSMVGRILFPGCKADMMPILVGPQGSRKSDLLMVIAPTPEHHTQVCLTKRAVDLAQDAIGRTLIVWEHLRGIKGLSDADEVKAFITSTYIEMPGRARMRKVRHKRRFILVGTSDKRDFLRDRKGHRRYLPFDVGEIAMEAVEEDKLQLWAEGRRMVLDRVARGQSPVDYEDAERLAVLEHPTYAKDAQSHAERRLQAWLGQRPDRFTLDQAHQAIGLLPHQISSAERELVKMTLLRHGYAKRSTRVPEFANPQLRWRRPAEQGA